jgi:hypothetical protein
MRKIRAETPSNPQQNHRGMELNAAADGPGRMVMRAVSFFGPGWIETEAKFSDVGGRNRRGGMTGVVSGLWGSAGSAMTNQLRPKKSLKNLSLSLAKFVQRSEGRASARPILQCPANSGLGRAEARASERVQASKS